MKLYYHKTDGGAEYLMDTYIDTGMDIKTGKILHREGVVTDKTKFVVRIDGDITKDAELSIRGEEEHDALVEVAGFMEETKEAFLNAVDCGESNASIVEIMRGFLAGDVITDALDKLASIQGKNKS